jgi:hypothetical protein
MSRPFTMSVPLLLLAVLIGCGDSDRRMAEMSAQHASEQARQNQEMGRLNREVAEGTRRTAETTQRQLDFQRELQAERRDLARSYRQESLLAAVIDHLGEVLVCLLPLIVCWYLLRGIRNDNDDAAVAEILIEEIASERPLLGPPQPQAELPKDAMSPGLLTGPEASSPTDVPAQGQ